MHKFTINASLQLLPLVQDKHAYIWVDEVIEIIQQSGIKHEIGAFATTLEGRYEEVFKVIHAVNDYLEKNNCTEWILNIQLQLRSNADITSEEKTSKYKNLTV